MQSLSPSQQDPPNASLMPEQISWQQSSHAPSFASLAMASLWKQLGQQALLVLDSSGPMAHVGLWCAEPAQYHHMTASAASLPCTNLLPMVAALLEKAGLTAQQLAGILVGVGPGSFTGLRIALATVKGMALGANIPIYSIASSALCLAVHRSDSNPLPAHVVVLYDARAGQWLASWHQLTSDEQLSCALKYPFNRYQAVHSELVSPAQLPHWLQQQQQAMSLRQAPMLLLAASGHREVLLPQSTSSSYGAGLQDLLQQLQQPVHPLAPQLWSAPLLLWQQLCMKQSDDPNLLLPRYGRQAIVTLQEPLVAFA